MGKTLLVLALTATLSMASVQAASATTEVTPLSPIINVEPTCADPSILISYIPQDGVVWSPADPFTLDPGQSQTAVATSADGYTFAPDAQTSFPFTDTFDPTKCPAPSPDSFKIWLGHRYNLTAGILKNDTVPDGCTSVITRANLVGGNLPAAMQYHKRSHQVTALTWTLSSRGLTQTFAYTVGCVEPGFNTASSMVTVTDRPAWRARIRLLSGHRYKVINRNSTFLTVQTWKPRGHQLRPPYTVPPHSAKIVKREHSENLLVFMLGKYKAHIGQHLLRAW